MRLIDVCAPSCLLLCLMLSPIGAAASSITGSFYLQGTALGTTDGIAFYRATPGDQKGSIALPTTGSLADLTPGDIQTIQDATSTNGVIPGTSFDFRNWVQLSDDINLDLTSIPIPDLAPCSGTESVGVSCLVNTHSPLILTQRADGVGAALSLYGVAHTAGQTNNVPL